ncbi:hypothetical protein [Streptomyces griseoruber]|uniref:Uncharacterized protein n=1 Tax=Streptomyces griseoruber TaxID=1943 RepID=A0A124I2R2_9ACTN|nr:hypothetical protein [Streptomyces griseoruber]KUN81360.1 hypothetical protein AQJ64_23530 [Streptomyces griseoruber]
MNVLGGYASEVWRAVRPVDRYQRLLWWCGTAMVASGAVHGVVALVDFAPWWGPVSWRKPVVFGVSFGLMAWAAVRILRQLAVRWWIRAGAGLVVLTSVGETALITAQRWRGTASHFNRATATDAAVWSAIGDLVVLLVLGVVVLCVAALVRFEGRPASRVAVLVGLAGVLAAGAIGQRMAAVGEQVFDETGHVPHELLFGAAGSAKLAHAVGLHGLQLLAVLAILCEAGRLGERAAGTVTGIAALGYAAAFTAITVTAYDGRAPLHPSAAMAVLLVAGFLTTAAAALVTFVRASSIRGTGSRPMPTSSPARPTAADTGRAGPT